jgi:hypothetical protein
MGQKPSTPQHHSTNPAADAAALRAYQDSKKANPAADIGRWLNDAAYAAAPLLGVNPESHEAAFYAVGAAYISDDGDAVYAAALADIKKGLDTVAARGTTTDDQS